MNQTISVITGDGIGPEIMDACLRVLDALECGLSSEFVEACRRWKNTATCCRKTRWSPSAATGSPLRGR